MPILLLTEELKEMEKGETATKRFPECDGCKMVCPYKEFWDEYEYQPPYCPGMQAQIELEAEIRASEETERNHTGRVY